MELVDELPPGAVYVRSTNGGVHNAGIVKWEINELLSGESFEAEVTVRYPDNYEYGHPTSSPLVRTNVVKLTSYTPE